MRWWRSLRLLLWVPLLGASFLLIAMHLVHLPKSDPRDDLKPNFHDVAEITARRIITTRPPTPERQTQDTTDDYPRYSPPYNSSERGLPFLFSPDLLRHYGLVGVRTLSHVPSDVRDRLVLVTAASSEFYSKALEAIYWVQKKMPGRKVIFYDLENGLQSKFREIGGRPCQVIYRQFKYSNYPLHVKDLHSYAWKFLIIKEVLKTEDAIFWIDSSIQVRRELPDDLAMAFGRSPVLLMAYSGHSNYAVTAPSMYSYLPTDRGRQKATLQYDANSMLIVNTQQAFESVLKWVYLCSLQGRCIAPPGVGTGCAFQGDSFGRYGRCHRFDQAAVNLVLANLHHYNYSNYVLNNGDYKIFNIHRYQHLDSPINICSKNMFDLTKKYNTGTNKVKK